MILNNTEMSIVKNILLYEHRKVASRLKFVKDDESSIGEDLLFGAIGLIDRLSRNIDDDSKNTVITLGSILWSYKNPEWSGLRDFLILILSRIGYSPSSVMFDDDYDHVNKSYSSMGGYINQLSVSLYQLEHEVIIGNEKILLTKFQKNVWDKITYSKVLGISAPTSAGKSFIIALKAIELLLEKNGTIVYIVPTLSLVSQVSIDFRQLLTRFGLSDYKISNTYYGEDPSVHCIYVLTQEKAIGAFGQGDEPFSDVRMLVVDEIQNVERVANEDDQRAKTLYDLMVDFRHSVQPDHIIISGPRIKNIGKLGVEVFGVEAEEEEVKSSPVSNLTYAIHKNSEGYFFRQYSTVFNNHTSIPISDPTHIAGAGGVQYTDKFHNYLSKVIGGLGNESKNIIFSPSPPQARRTALYISKDKEYVFDVRINDLVEYLSETVHPKYELCNTLRRGVAYHHGKLPHHVRRVLEKAISEKLINNVVCTTTLMQGVNLPAQNVIIRNPNLFVTRQYGEPILTDYEIANLRGRAGRLLKDFMGRTFVLDENAFSHSESQQGQLFKETTKELKPGYGETFEFHRDSISYGLSNDELPSDNNNKYSYLLTYIRQTILRHGDASAKRFKTVGIELSNNELNSIKKGLSNLSVPIKICLENRYWDPLDIDRLYKMKDKFYLPSNTSEANISYSLKNLVQSLKTDFNIYYRRYFNMPENNKFDLLMSACINAEQWLRQKPLSKILNTQYHDDSDKIEKTIGLLQNRISYGLPLLLKPLYAMNLPDNPFLRCIESGAYHPVARRLIEYCVPRETAIYLSSKYLSGLDIYSSNFDSKMLDLLRFHYKSLNYWTRAQLEALV